MTVNELETLVVRFLDTHRKKGPPNTCLFCGGEELKGNPILPFGTRRTGHSWVHSRCWPAWHERRRQIAVERIRKEHANETLAATEPDQPDLFSRSAPQSKAPVGSQVQGGVLEPAV